MNINTFVGRLSILAIFVFAAGCAGFHLDPVTPQSGPTSVTRSMPVSTVNVIVSSSMPADQQNVLRKYAVAPAMQQALLTSFQNAGKAGPNGATVNVTLTRVRFSAWGPTRMHSQTQVIGQNGQQLKSFENESFSMRSKALSRVAQDQLRKIASNI